MGWRRGPVVGLLVSEFLGLEKAFKVGRPVNFVRASRRIEGFLGPSPRYANYTENFSPLPSAR
jgi:hypothetical protein